MLSKREKIFLELIEKSFDKNNHISKKINFYAETILEDANTPIDRSSVYVFLLEISADLHNNNADCANELAELIEKFKGSYRT